MFKQIVGRARAALSCVRQLLQAQPSRRAARTLAAVAVLLCATVIAAPAMAQAVRLTSVSTNSYSAKGQVITFNFSVDSNSTPITGVTFNDGAPSTLVSGTCSTITSTGTCTATYTINDDDMAQGRVLVSPSFQMWRLGSDGNNYRWAGGSVSTPSAPFWILANATPSDPGNVAAVAGVGSARVSFSPSNVPGGATVTYLVMSTDFTAMAQGNSSPVVVTGLTPGKSYQFNVQAMSEGYSSLQVGPSNPVVPTAPNVSIAVSPASVGEDSGTPLVYTVTRNVALTTPTTVNLTFTGTATAGIDYNGNVASVTIPANASSATLSLVPVADTTAEADETAVVSVAAGTGYTVGSPSSATGTILNANQPTLSISDVSQNEGNAGTTEFIFTVSLSKPAGANGVTFAFSTADGTATAGSDYDGASGMVSMAMGSSTAQIHVVVNGDTTYEPDETFFVNLSNVSGATTVDVQGVGTILNDDPVPAPTISSIAPNNGPAVGGTSVTLTGANFSGATAVQFGATAATRYTVNSATSITATSPAGSAGTVDITVATAGGTSATSAADQFTYVNPPNAAQIDLLNVPYNSGFVPVPVDTSNHVTGVAVASAPSHGGTIAVGKVLTYKPVAGYAGSDSFTYILSNVAGTSAPATVTVTVIAPTLGLSPAPGTLPGAAMGMAYSQLFVGSGGAAPYFYQLTGNPPNGLTINSTTGMLSGTPTAPGTFTFDVMATDSSTGSVAPFSKTQSYSLTVSPPPAVESITRSDRSPTNASILTFSVTFSEPVSGVDSTDFSLTSTGTASGLMRWIVGSGSVYSVAVGNVSGNGTLRLDLNASGTGIQGVALGNAIAGGFTAGQVYTVDTAAPVVASVSVPAAGRYPAGSTLDFLVTFNEVIVVTGNPQLALIVGGSTVFANYATGSGTQALRFSYTVASGDRDDDGIAVGALGLNGGSLKDEAGNDASQTLNNVSTTSAVLVGLMTQAITGFTATPATPVFSAGGTFAVSATGGASGEAVLFASTTPAVCTVAGSTVTMVSAGSCELTANQAGNSDYSAAPQEPLSVTIGAGTQAITGFTATPANPVFSVGGTFAVSATGGASGEAVLFASSTPAICTVAGSTVTMIAAGSCALTADQAGSTNYGAAPQEVLSVSIGLASQSITGFVANPSAPVFSAGGTFAVSANGGGSGEAVVFASTTPSVCTVAGSTVTMVSAGACDLTANQAGNSNYMAAPRETLSVTIDAAAQAITGFVANPSAPVFAAGGTFTVSASGGASGEAVLFASTTPAICTVAGSTVTMVGAGSCALTADQAGNANYSAASQETLNVSIDVASQAIIGFTATPADPVFSAGGTFALNANGGASGEAVVFASTTPAVCTVAGSTVTMVAAGSCALTANQAGNANYNAALQEVLSVTIGAATQAITGFTATPATPVFSAGGTFALSANGGASGEAVVFASTTPVVCTVAGSTVTVASAGICELTANQAGNGNYVAASQEVLSVSIGLASQSITGFVANPSAPVFSAGDTFAVSANGGASGEPVVFASTTPTICTVAGSTVTMVAAGSCALTADQAGNANYSAAPQEVLGVSIGMASQSITGFVANPAAPVFSAGGTFALSANGGASGEAVVFASTTPAICTVAGSTVTMVSAGSCALTADQTGNANYNAALQEVLSVTIGAATQTITGFTATPATPVFSAGGTFALNANGGASGEAVVFASTTPAVCTVAGSTVTMVAAGSCALTADQTGNTNYSAAPQGVLSVSIGMASQSITGFVANPAAPVFSAGGTFALSANGGASGEAVLFASTTPAVCTVAGSTVTIVAAGSCALTADQAGNANYSAAQQEALSVSIGMASQSITGFVANPAAPVFLAGGTFAVNASGGASGEVVLFASTTPAVCTVAGSTVMMVSAGTCELTSNQAGNGNYNAAPQETLSVTIGAATQAITGFTATPATPVFSAGGTFALSANGGASGEAVLFGSTTPSVCTVAGSTVTMIAAGSCALTADQAGSTNYSAARQEVLSVSIGLASQSITGFVANPSAPVFSAGGTFALGANGGASGEAVLFASTTPAVCTVVGSTVTMVAAGSCALTADQAGSASYSAAPQETLSITIGAATQAITGFTATPANPVFLAGGSFAVSANGGASGEAVMFGSTTPAVCTVAGSTVTMVAAGSCALTADQAGNASYNAAPQEVLSVSIGLASQSITGFVANPSAPVFSAGGTFALSANGGTSGEAVLFASTTPAVCTVVGSTVTMVAAGSCALTADQAGNASYSPAPQVNLQAVIGKASPVLSWLADLRKRRGEAAFDLPDPGSDGPGGFSFQSSDANVARIDGRTVTLVGAGTATLTATQAASADFIEASVSLQLTVDERPDPSHDPGVTAGVQAQVDASLRFVQAQQDNIRSRLSQLRHGGSASSHAMSVNLQGAAGQQGLSLNAGQLGAPPPKLPAGWGFWSAGAIQWGERDARGNAEGAKFRTDGVSVGMDRRFGEHAAFGLAGGFGWNETDFNSVGSGMDSRQRSLAMYGNWHDRAWFVDGLVGWGQLDFDIRRRSNDVGASATASREGKQHYASLSLGYDHQGEVGMLTGYGRLDASRTTLQAYREHGLGDYDLQYRRQTLDSSTAALGVEGRYAFRTARASVRPSWMLEWRQALRSNGDAALNYVVAPSENDYLLGVRSYNDNTLAFGGGVEFGFSSGWTMALQFRREQARDVFANSFGLRLSYGQQAPLLDAEQAWWRESGLTRPQLEAVPRGGK